MLLNRFASNILILCLYFFSYQQMKTETKKIYRDMLSEKAGALLPLRLFYECFFSVFSKVLNDK